MKYWLSGLFMLLLHPAFCQMQACPLNINFALGDLTHWYAYTGNNAGGNGPGAIGQKYDSTTGPPYGTAGTKSILEYNLASSRGIQVITSSFPDPFGAFPTIPVINGYKYNYAIQLGSTAISLNSGPPQQQSSQGGYIRGVSYNIHVPAGPVTEPYTMTYAYAMVLENGTHISSQQPLFSATLKVNNIVITCASPSYYLPTFNNAAPGQRGATLDSATAIKNGFVHSRVASPNPAPGPTGNGTGAGLQDVWTKGWREVTFDLSPYRGQQVSLTFEADNCIPGGHFAYAYIALRNSCAGLEISGDSLVCNNTDLVYSVPALAGATYEWLVPDGWLVGSDTSNILLIRSGNKPGYIVAKEENSCAKLQDTLQIKSLPSPVGGKLTPDTTVCSTGNTVVLSLHDYLGTISKWLSSADGNSWQPIQDNTDQYTVQDLTSTTLYKVMVENGTVCKPDSSFAATVTVDQKTIAGLLSPQQSTICVGQVNGELLSIIGSLGSILNWQSSTDGIQWTDFNPVKTDLLDYTGIIKQSTQYRSIVKNGVCAADTTSIAYVALDLVPFPEATIDPADTTICYGATDNLHGIITIGTAFSWSGFNDNGEGSSNNHPGSLPYSFSNIVSPQTTGDYILQVRNEGCPNLLSDTFHVNVLQQIIVDAGRDTAIVANQPLQLNASSNDSLAHVFNWSPDTGLNDPDIPDPLVLLGTNIDKVPYTIRSTNSIGCYSDTSITVKVFKTKPDIFVPNAFTPGKSVNGIFRPIPVGISSLRYFRIYNRSGQLVYSTSSIGQGWNGTVNGKTQDSGAFVWMVEGTDYTGNIISRKGSMVLIR